MGPRREEKYLQRKKKINKEHAHTGMGFLVAWATGNLDRYLHKGHSLPLMDKEDYPPMPKVKPPRNDNGR